MSELVRMAELGSLFSPLRWRHHHQVTCLPERRSWTGGLWRRQFQPSGTVQRFCKQIFYGGYLNFVLSIYRVVFCRNARLGTPGQSGQVAQWAVVQDIGAGCEFVPFPRWLDFVATGTNKNTETVMMGYELLLAFFSLGFLVYIFIQYFALNERLFSGELYYSLVYILILVVPLRLECTGFVGCSINSFL